MEAKLYNELVKQDKKRLKIRKDYKNKLASSKPKSSSKDYIYFPKSIVSDTNYQLRYGLSWLQNGFIIKKGRNIIAVDPGVDFVLRLTESGFDLRSITHLFISHAHLDHAASANTLMDFMIRAKSNIKIIAPKSVYDEVENIDGYKMTFVPLFHSIECSGFKISNNKQSYIYLIQAILRS